ncbi:FAD-dependent monooxygenase [Leucobacter allii]|uniref:FAD-dependent monooxygenase n=1 Tax=Leucobacter allii TaxID=2932247 RepID=A0ABY4FIS1_9MICO|nr:FAD-dependent monooxygenase [Leucobacter allii]UOQ55872.1 FAD-dependent monooxygenase [Leucobacter allii]
MADGAPGPGGPGALGAAGAAGAVHAGHDAIIVGAGPAGLCAAAELARAGVDVLLLERRETRAAGSRAIGVHPPTLRALEAGGVTERILTEAVRIRRGEARSAGRAGPRLGAVTFAQVDRRFPFIAAAPQAATEAALAAAAPPPVFGVEVLALDEDEAGVTVRVRLGGRAGATIVGAGAVPARLEPPAGTAPGTTPPTGRIAVLRARVVIVAAGGPGRALLPRAFRPRGRVYGDRYLMTDLASAPEEPAGTAVLTLAAAGVVESFPLPGGGRRLVAWDGRVERDPATPGTAASGRPPGFRGDAPIARAAAARLGEAVAQRTGSETLAARVESASGFGIRRVLLDRLRTARIIAIGDAAHEVSPIGGQGMNLGLVDAATLAPALAAWLRRREGDPEPERRLARWERRRLASARTAARLAGLDTALGRGRSPVAAAALRAAIAAAAAPLARPAARAFAMGLDRDAGGR